MTETTKAKLYDEFWKSFGLRAFEENSVPTGKNKPPYPYITYQYSTSGFDNTVMLTASLWYRSTSWEPVLMMADDVAGVITDSGVNKVSEDGSQAIWVKRGTPFMSRMPDEADDNMVKRMLINVEVEFLSIEQ